MNFLTKVDIQSICLLQEGVKTPFYAQSKRDVSFCESSEITVSE